jgi:hypothetical protein
MVEGGFEPGVVGWQISEWMVGLPGDVVIAAAAAAFDVAPPWRVVLICAMPTGADMEPAVIGFPPSLDRSVVVAVDLRPDHLPLVLREGH